jgi:hypothetical protein
MSEPIHDAELAALQSALTRLNPAPDGINLAQLMFRAGRASVPPRGWAWPGAAAVSLLLAAVLGVALALRPGPQVIDHVVTVSVVEPSLDKEPPAPPIAAAAPAAEPQPRTSETLKLRQQALANGLDALPASTPWPAAAPPRNLDTLLDLPADAAQDPWFQRLKHSLQSGDAS